MDVNVTVSLISFIVIDLVEALNLPHRKSASSGMIYKLRNRAPHLTLPTEYSHFLYSNLQGSMGVHVVGRQAPRSTATIFSLSSASSPILQIISSTVNNTLLVDYQVEGRAHDFASINLLDTNPFASEQWGHLAVSLEPDRLVFFVDCQEAAVFLIENENRINLELPQDVLITLGSTLGKRSSKFSVSFLCLLHICFHTENIERHHLNFFIYSTLLVFYTTLGIVL